jgi:plasmid stability protein
MPQLLVRDIESAVVKKLRSSAAAQGISVEEAHRRVLRSALLGDKHSPQRNIIEYIRSIPPSDDIDFPRNKSLPREVSL